MTDEREEFVRHLIARYKAGSLEKDYVLQGIAEYDALAATKRMRLYSLLSTIAGGRFGTGFCGGRLLRLHWRSQHMSLIDQRSMPSSVNRHPVEEAAS